MRPQRLLVVGKGSASPPLPPPPPPPAPPVRAAVVCLQDITADIISLSPAIDQYQVLMMLGVVLLIMEFVVFVDFLFGDLQVPVPSSACTPPPPLLMLAAMSWSGVCGVRAPISSEGGLGGAREGD